MFKGLITGLLLGTATLFAQEKSEDKKYQLFPKDSIITHTLEDVIIKGDKKKIDLPDAKTSGFATVYGGDANKILMSENSGVFTIIPIYAKLRITNMDPSFIGLSYQDIPILLDNTQLHGGLSIINSQASNLELKKTAFESKYSAIGSVMEVFPKEHNIKPALSLYSDFLERSVVFSTNLETSEYMMETISAFRNIGFPNPLKDLVTELKILPDIYEFMNSTVITNDEMEAELFLRVANGNGAFTDEKEKITLNEHSSNNFILARYSFKFKDDNVNIKIANENNNNTISYDFSTAEDNLRIFTRNTTLALNAGNKQYDIGARLFFLTNGTKDEYENKEIIDVYADYKYVMGTFLVSPSIRLVNGDAKIRSSQGLTVTYFIDNSTIGAGYTHPVNMLVTNNSSAENALHLDRLGDQYADHYTAFLKIDMKDLSEELLWLINDVDISYYQKNFTSGRDRGSVDGWDFMIRNNSKINYTLKYSVGDALLNGKQMPGSIKEIFNIDVAFPLLDELLLNTQFTSSSGYVIKDKVNNTLETIGKANYLSAGLTYKFSLLGSEVSTSLTVFNILRLLGNDDVPEFARYKIGDKTKSIKMPPFGDLRVNLNMVF